MSNHDCGCSDCEGCRDSSTAIAPQKMHGHQVTILSGAENARQNGRSDDLRQRSGTYLVLGSALFLAGIAFFTAKS